MEKLVKFLMNSLYGENIRKDVTEIFFLGNPSIGCSTQYDENVLDYWKLPNNEYIVKLQEDQGLDSGTRYKKYNAFSSRYLLF